MARFLLQTIGVFSHRSGTLKTTSVSTELGRTSSRCIKQKRDDKSNRYTIIILLESTSHTVQEGLEIKIYCL